MSLSPNFFGQPVEPCDDCLDGWCTMNCSVPMKRTALQIAIEDTAAEAGREETIKQCAQIARDYFERFDDATKGMLRANVKYIGADIAKAILALSRDKETP